MRAASKGRADDTGPVDAEARADAAIGEVSGSFGAGLQCKVIGKAVAQTCRSGERALIVIRQGAVKQARETGPAENRANPPSRKSWLETENGKVG